jgi:hypothetical protein
MKIDETTLMNVQIMEDLQDRLDNSLVKLKKLKRFLPNLEREVSNKKEREVLNDVKEKIKEITEERKEDRRVLDELKKAVNVILDSTWIRGREMPILKFNERLEEFKLLSRPKDTNPKTLDYIEKVKKGEINWDERKSKEVDFETLLNPEETISFDIPHDKTLFVAHNLEASGNGLPSSIDFNNIIYKPYKFDCAFLTQFMGFYVNDNFDDEEISVTIFFISGFRNNASTFDKMVTRGLRHVTIKFNYYDLYNFLFNIDKALKSNSEVIRSTLDKDIADPYWDFMREATGIEQDELLKSDPFFNHHLSECQKEGYQYLMDMFMQSYIWSKHYSDRSSIKGERSIKFNKKKLPKLASKKPLESRFVFVRDSKDFSSNETYPVSKIDWDFHILIQGHWRHFYLDPNMRLKSSRFLNHDKNGHDRQGRKITGKTWVKEHKKGDTTKRLLEQYKVRKNPQRKYKFNFK